MSRYIGLLILGLIFSSSADAQKVRFKLQAPEDGISIQGINENYDIPGISMEENTVDFVSDLDYYQELKDMGYPVELLEVQRAPDEEYLNPTEILEIISEVTEEYPELTHVRKIGTSLEGRPIYAVRVSLKDESVAFKPTILFNSMHHAREIMTTEVTTDMLRYLTENYYNDETPWVQEWVDNLAIWIVPQVNPDGNQIVWENDSWWRKNARGDEWGRWGVDLNRNYPYEWGACNGSSGSKRSQTYRGPQPGSEPETQALMNLVKSENMVIDVSYHSYSELVIAPYGCHGAYTPEKFIVDSIGKELAERLEKDTGRGHYTYGTGWEILYPVDGDDISWMYQDVNTIAYVIEVNSSRQGFQPSYSRWRDVTVKRQRQGWFYLLNRLMAGPQVRGFVLDASTGDPIKAELRVEGIDYSDERPRQTNRGVYYKMLTPGSYELTFNAVGYEPQTISVSLGEEPVELNVELFPADPISW